MNKTARIRDAEAPLRFASPEPVLPKAEARRIVDDALAKWQAAEAGDARRIAATLAREFPDQAAPDGFWHSEARKAFRDFFVWGHDHDFGHGVARAGAMGARHVEIACEGLELGMLPSSLQGKKVLDVGCWSGGDLLILAGMGATVTAVEEHRTAAAAAMRLLRLLGLDAPVHTASLYAEDRAWAQAFDHVYCAGVIYHVTDPLLLLRIMFAYLKPGGTVFLETKAAPGAAGICDYSGTLEKGWNWYAPDETAFGRWLVDAGFDAASVRVFRRSNGRLLACGTKTAAAPLRETAGFSRPGSWLEGAV